jgi:hypothetical protein
MPLSARSPQEVGGQTAVEAGRFVDALMRVQFDSPYSFEQVLSIEMRAHVPNRRRGPGHVDAHRAHRRLRHAAQAVGYAGEGFLGDRYAAHRGAGKADPAGSGGRSRRQIDPWPKISQFRT